MATTRAVFVAMLMTVSSLALAQQAKKQDLENILWDVDQQWLCTGPYQKSYKDCVQFRSRYWVDDLWEIESKGVLPNMGKMVPVKSSANPARGVGPNPADFKLLAVYEN